MDAAKRQLEWMSDSVVQKFENSRTNPFDFSCVIHSSHNLPRLSHFSGMAASLIASVRRHTLTLSRHLIRCTSLAAYEKLPNGPRVVLATMPSLEFGFARDLFINWAANPRNVVVRI